MDQKSLTYSDCQIVWVNLDGIWISYNFRLGRYWFEGNIIVILILQIRRIHICVTHIHTQPGVADRFINDIRRELTELLKNPEEPVEGKVRLMPVI